MPTDTGRTDRQGKLVLSGEQIEHQSTNKRKSSLFEAQVSRNFRLGESYSKIIEHESTTIHNPPLLHELRSEALSKEVICDNCGAIVENGHKFCGQCGQRVTINKAKKPEVSLLEFTEAAQMEQPINSVSGNIPSVGKLGRFSFPMTRLLTVSTPELASMKKVLLFTTSIV